jgi:hypothetical protein
MEFLDLLDIVVVMGVVRAQDLLVLDSEAEVEVPQ